MPTVRTRMMERLVGPRRSRHRRSIAIAAGGGIAVAPIVGLLRPALARLRELLG